MAWLVMTKEDEKFNLYRVIAFESEARFEKFEKKLKEK